MKASTVVSGGLTDRDRERIRRWLDGKPQPLHDRIRARLEGFALQCPTWAAVLEVACVVAAAYLAAVLIGLVGL